ncbi:hypothetical protein LTR62_002610 [Meristemomyces frigidus]|uniref:Uncharacterized protein n=1 Tax=Meristemomyces frigidus TaxID=1508187 RepID=A0AAN7TGR8_9PEZI|nr:hypothetical protein LTR62_002610 [Meristemomyces frigidus]
MSLKEAYTLAHTAQCRLNIEASRPDRNLRFVVGHLMHYEHLRLRIVEIEHDISKSHRAQAVAFKGTGHVGGEALRHKPSTGQLGKRSPPPSVLESADDYDDDDEDEDFDDDMEIDAEEDGLGLMRFPSGSARAPQPPPELEPDDDEDEDDDVNEPVSPEEPDQATIEQALKGQADELLMQGYNNVRKCPCHGKTKGAPEITRMWELPASEQNGKSPGVTYAVAEVTAEA